MNTRLVMRYSVWRVNSNRVERKLRETDSEKSSLTVLKSTESFHSICWNEDKFLVDLKCQAKKWYRMRKSGSHLVQVETLKLT